MEKQPKPLLFFGQHREGEGASNREQGRGGFSTSPAGNSHTREGGEVRWPVTGPTYASRSPLRLTPIASSSTEGERGFAKGLRPLAGDSRTPVGKEKEGGAGGVAGDLTHGRLSPPRSSPTLAPQRGTDDEGRRSGLGFGDLDPTRPPPGRPPSPDAGDTAANRVGRGR